MSIYNNKKFVLYQEHVYERLTDHPSDERYRVLIDYDDYDYVEDTELCDFLDTLPTL